MDMDVPWRLLSHRCCFQFGHAELEPGDIICRICESSRGFGVKEFTGQAKRRTVHEFGCVALEICLQGGVNAQQNQRECLSPLGGV